MVKVKLYIEGGGDSATQDTEFRKGWEVFFRKAGLTGRMPGTVRGSGREQTFDLYQTAVRTRRPGELPLLLVDSEDLLTDGASPWEHLSAREGWSLPPGAAEEDVYLMVCCMETWFLADRETLRSHFPGLIEKHLRPWPHLETVPKDAVLSALKLATARCGNPYGKGKPSFDLLGKIQPQAVEAKCPAAAQLLERLRNELG